MWIIFFVRNGSWVGIIKKIILIWINFLTEKNAFGQNQVYFLFLRVFGYFRLSFILQQKVLIRYERSYNVHKNPQVNLRLSFSMLQPDFENWDCWSMLRLNPSSWLINSPATIRTNPLLRSRPLALFNYKSRHLQNSLMKQYKMKFC